MDDPFCKSQRNRKKGKRNTSLQQISTSLAFFPVVQFNQKEGIRNRNGQDKQGRNQEQIPQNTRKPGSSRLAKGEAIIEQKFRKHSANQPPNKPVTTGTRIGIVFFITSSLMPGVLSLYCNQTPLSRNFYAVTAQLMSFLYWSQHPTFSSEA